MEGFDEAGVFYSDRIGGEANEKDSLKALKMKYKEFLRTYTEENFSFKYR